MICMKSTLICCGLGVSVVIGIVWGHENALGASVGDSSFDWRNPNDMGNNFVSPVKSQGNTPQCSFFARVGAAEAWYKITRGDATNVWCGAAQNGGGIYDQTGLSEQTVVNLDYNYGINGTFPDMVNPNDPSDNRHGLLTRVDLNWHSSGSLDPPQPGWTIPSDCLNRRFFITSCTTAIPTPGSAQVKAMLLDNGPFRIPIHTSYDFLSNFDNYPGPPPSSNHSVLVSGWQNLPTSDPNYSACGGGYFIVKNSWGNSGGQYGSYVGIGSGYYGVPYAVLDERADYVSDMVTGPAYFNGPLSWATWTNGSGNSNWNTSSGNWSHTAGTWGQGEVTGGWLNGETAATFSGTGATTITVDANSHISAYGITVTPGSNYTFAGGPLVITGYHNDPVVAGGGINAHSSITFNNAKITVGAPSTWTVDSGQTLTVNAPVDLNINTLTIDGSGTTNLNGVVSDVVTNPAFSGLLAGYSGSLVKNGAGTLNINDPSTRFYGSLAVNVGTVNAHDLNLSNLEGTTAGTLSVDGALNIGSNNTSVAFSGTLAGNCVLTKTGTGTLALYGMNNTYSGGTNVQGGLIKVLGTGSLGPGDVTLDGGGLSFGQPFDFNRPITISSTGGTLDTSTTNGTVSSAISGSGSLTKTGAGTLTLSGNNSYTGPTNFNGGLINVTGVNVLGGSDNTSALVFDGGGIQFDAPFDPTGTGRTIVLNSGGGIFDTQNYNISIAAPLSGSGGIMKAGSGSLNLNINNTTDTFFGSLTVNEGTVGPIDSNTLKNNTLVWNGGNLNLVGTAPTTLNLGGLAGSASTGSLGVSTSLIVGHNNSSTTFSGNLAGDFTFVKTGTGSLTLSGNNTYKGNTYLNGGLISATTLSNLGAGSQLVFDGGGLHFNTSSFDASRRTMVFAGDATLDTREGDNVWLSRSIGGGGSGSLTKTGEGRLSLYGANTYSGDTTVAEGVLSPRNTTGSATGSGSVMVDSGAMLAGWGIIDGPVTVAGTLAPDNCAWSNSTPEILTINNEVTFLPGSTFDVVVNGLTPGSDGYGQLLTTGLVTLDGLLDLTFGEFTPTGNDILFLINNMGDEDTSGIFQFADDSKIGTYNGFDWYITYDADYGLSPNYYGGNDVAICSFAVPEPSSIAMLLAGIVGMLICRRVRVSRNG